MHKKLLLYLMHKNSYLVHKKMLFGVLKWVVAMVHTKKNIYFLFNLE